MVAVIGINVLLTAVKADKFPAPVPASPISGFELVQVSVAPGGVLLKILSGTVAPLQ